jgi:hypothetical protein
MDIPFPSLLIKGFPQESRFLRVRREQGKGVAMLRRFVIPLSLPGGIPDPL